VFGGVVAGADGEGGYAVGGFEGKQQIPGGNDRKKGKSNGNSQNAGISPLPFGYAQGSVEMKGLWG